MSAEEQPHEGERRQTLNQLKEFGHFLQRMRVAQIAVLFFVCYITWDFHSFYKDHALDMTEWQLVGVGAYIAGFVSALKIMFEAIGKKVDRDD